MTSVRFCFRVVPLLFLASFTGCASVMHGRTQTVPVTSNPPGARVTVDGDSAGVTPLNVPLRRGRPHVISLAIDSVPPVEVALSRRLSGWVLGNMMMYYLPAIVDFSTGAAYNVSPGVVSVAFPGAKGVDVAASMGLTPGKYFRFAAPSTNSEFVSGIVDSVAAGRLFWRQRSPNAAAVSAPAIAITEIPRLQLLQPPARRTSGMSGIKVASLLTFGIPMVAFALEGDIAFGLFIGALYSIPALPAGFAIGAAAAPERWASVDARLANSPLLVNDRVRVRMHQSNSRIDGRLKDVEPQDLALVVKGQTVRVKRSSVQSLQRSEGFDFRRGVTRGLVAGAVLGFVSLSLCDCRTTQRDFALVTLAGASLGLFAAPAVAPIRWVDVLRW